MVEEYSNPFDGSNAKGSIHESAKMMDMYNNGRWIDKVTLISMSRSAELEWILRKKHA
jgi:hypothetical protein